MRRIESSFLSYWNDDIVRLILDGINTDDAINIIAVSIMIDRRSEDIYSNKEMYTIDSINISEMNQRILSSKELTLEDIDENGVLLTDEEKQNQNQNQ